MAQSITSLRQVAYRAQLGRCFYCSAPMWEDEPTEFVARYRVSRSLAFLLRCTAEHLDPKSCGGRDSIGNIVAACWFCNQTRHRAHTPLGPERYRQKVQSRVARGRWPTSRLCVATGRVPSQ